MKNFGEISVSIYDSETENEAFAEWLILAVLAPLWFGGRPFLPKP